MDVFKNRQFTLQKRFYSGVLSAKISPREEEPVCQQHKGTWPFETSSSRELLCWHRPPDLPSPCRADVPSLCGCTARLPPPRPHSVVDGSFFTRRCSRMEDSMGFSCGLGLELFRAEYVAAIAPLERRRERTCLGVEELFQKQGFTRLLSHRIVWVKGTFKGQPVRPLP